MLQEPYRDMIRRGLSREEAIQILAEAHSQAPEWTDFLLAMELGELRGDVRRINRLESMAEEDLRPAASTLMTWLDEDEPQLRENIEEDEGYPPLLGEEDLNGD